MEKEEEKIEEEMEAKNLREEIKEEEKQNELKSDGEEKELKSEEEENELKSKEEKENEFKFEEKKENELKCEKEKEFELKSEDVDNELKSEEEEIKIKSEELEIEIKYEEQKENELKLEQEEKKKETEIIKKEINLEPAEEEYEEEREKIEIVESEKDNFKCPQEKCDKCNEESIELNLCQKCNAKKGYYPLNVRDNYEPNEYLDCYNEITKPQGFYLDKQNEEYNLCHSNCEKCDFGGDGNENNCTSCKKNLIFKPDISNSTNCVIKCKYFYYFQGEQYRCTIKEYCPNDYKLEIKEKKKCIDKCENDNTYKIQYDGECYEEPPEGTIYDEVDKISKDIDINKCKSNEKKLRLSSSENITEYEVESKARLYAEEFDYTNEHVTVYKNEFYSIIIYKDSECLSELDLNVDEIDFGECYTKIKELKNIEGNLIFVIISKIVNNITIIIASFIFNPISKEKINYFEICNDETLTINRNLKEQIKNSDNFESIEDLAKQGIDIFDPNSDFYTDLCFHFKSPIDGKDIPVKDRIRLFFPNITLCEEGCNIKGVNLTTLKVMCECTLNNLINNNCFRK